MVVTAVLPTAVAISRPRVSRARAVRSPRTGYGPYLCGVTGVTVHIPLLGTSPCDGQCGYTLRDDHPLGVLPVGVVGVRAGRRHRDRAAVRYRALWPARPRRLGADRAGQGRLGGHGERRPARLRRRLSRRSAPRRRGAAPAARPVAAALRAAGVRL